MTLPPTTRQLQDRLQRLTARNEGRPLALVAGDAINALGVVRSLGRDGVQTVLLTSRARSYVARSRFVGCVIPCADVFGPGFPDALMALAPLFPSPPVLFLTHDHQVLRVSGVRDVLGSHYRFRLPEHPMVESLLSKWDFSTSRCELGSTCRRPS